jgi:hypothetical protein
MQYYPALLVVYSAGIVALAARHFMSLAALLRHPEYRMYPRGRSAPAVAQLAPTEVFSNGAERLIPGPAGQGKTPVSDYLFAHLRPLLRDYLPDDGEYEDAFDAFEFLFALNIKDLVHEEALAMGRYWWRYTNQFEGSIGEYSPDSLFGEFRRFGLDWSVADGLLQAGFFGSTDSLSRDTRGRCDKLVKAHREQMVVRAAQASLGS